MNNNTFQYLVDGLSNAWQKERSKTQMTLGKMILFLKNMPPEALIDTIINPHSYRGYYEDLAFERRDGKITALDALELCQSAMGKTFKGYKGGDFMMGESTPVWMAVRGKTGQRIMQIRDDGSFEIAREEE